MTTAPAAIRPPAAPPAKAPAHSPSAAPSGVMIDPVRLLKKYKTLLVAATIAGVVVGVAGHFAMLRWYPIYVASMVFQCHPPDLMVGKIVPGADKDETEKFMARQVQIMLSDQVIDKAVSNPQLDRLAPSWYQSFVRKGEFDRQEAAKKLKKVISASSLGNSDFIKLQISGQDKEDVTALADIVGRAYKDTLDQQHQREIGDRKEAIQKNIDENKAQIDRLQKDRERKMTDGDVDSVDAQATAAAHEVQYAAQILVEVRLQKEAIATRLQRMLEQLNNPAGITYPDEIAYQVERDPVVGGLRANIASYEAQLLAMQQRGITPQHRDYKTLVGLVEGMRQKAQLESETRLRQLFGAMIDNMKTQYTQLAAQEAEQMARLESARQKSLDMMQVLSQVRDISEEIAMNGQAKVMLLQDLKNIEGLQKLTSASRVSVYANPQLPKEVSFPKLLFMVPAGVVLVVGLVAFVVLMLEVLDQRVKSPADVAMIPRTRVLGLIPHASEDPSGPQKIETVFRDQPGGVLAESYRHIRSGLAKRLLQAGHKSLLVVSGMPASGATSAAVNLAYAFAASEQRVLVIDANFRRPAINKALGLAEGPGLADVIAGGATLAAAVQKTDEPRLSVLSAGTPSNRRFELLAAEGVGQVIRDATAAFDLVIIDVAPAMVAGDAIALAGKCDASMLVVRAMSEKRGMVARLRNDLSECKAEFLGVLVNGVRSAAGGYLRGNIRATHKYQNGKD